MMDDAAEATGEAMGEIGRFVEIGATADAAQDEVDELGARVAAGHRQHFDGVGDAEVAQRVIDRNHRRSVP